MTRNRHAPEFREQALSKVRQRGARSVQDIANDLNMSAGTLRKWIGQANKKDSEPVPEHQLPSNLPVPSWSPAQRLLALNHTYTLSGEKLHAWCRENGLFEHQLKAWREAFCGTTAPDAKEAKSALRELQVKHEVLQRELRRKEKALAEAAALLVLQKKFQALWEGEEK